MAAGRTKEEGEAWIREQIWWQERNEERVAAAERRKAALGPGEAAGRGPGVVMLV